MQDSIAATIATGVSGVSRGTKIFRLNEMSRGEYRGPGRKYSRQWNDNFV